MDINGLQSRWRKKIELQIFLIKIVCSKKYTSANCNVYLQSSDDSEIVVSVIDTVTDLD